MDKNLSQASVRETKHKNTEKKEKNIFKRILIVFFVFILIFAISSFVLWQYIFGNLRNTKNIEEDLSKLGEGISLVLPEEEKEKDKIKEEKTQESLDKDKLLEENKQYSEIDKVEYAEELSHILLIGVDSRNLENINTNADVLMILTLDQKNKKLKLTSIQRDLLIYVPARQNFFKLNSVMFAGPKAMMDVLNANYQLNLSKYAVINLAGAEEVVNILGGLEFDVPNNPRMIEYWNDVIDRTNKDLGKQASLPITKTGKQLLDGRQAITYARLRKLDTDFQRIKRQQEILTQLFNKLKESSTFQILNVLNKAFSYVSTNMSSLEIAGIATSVLPNLDTEVDRLSIPIEGYYKGVTLDGIYYTAQRLAAQLPLIQKFLNNKDVNLPLKVPEYWPSDEITSTKNEEEKSDSSSQEEAEESYIDSIFD